MSKNYQAFIRHLEKQCGDEPSFVVLLRYEKKEEAFKRILEKSKIIFDEDVIKKISYEGLKLTLYETGKIILHGIDAKKNAVEILNKVLSP